MSQVLDIYEREYSLDEVLAKLESSGINLVSFFNNFNLKIGGNYSSWHFFLTQALEENNLVNAKRALSNLFSHMHIQIYQQAFEVLKSDKRLYEELVAKRILIVNDGFLKSLIESNFTSCLDDCFDIESIKELCSDFNILNEHPPLAINQDCYRQAVDLGILNGKLTKRYYRVVFNSNGESELEEGLATIESDYSGDESYLISDLSLLIDFLFRLHNSLISKGFDHNALCA